MAEQVAVVLQQLSLEAEALLEASEPEEWGELIELAEGEKFLGRYLGEEQSPVANRPVFLLLAEGLRCFIRERTVLRSEFDRKRPARGDWIVIARGRDRAGRNGTYHSYVVTTAPCAEPLPELQPASVGGGGAGDGDGGVPFEPVG